MPRRLWPSTANERFEIDVECEYHVYKVTVEPQHVQPPSIEGRDAQEMAQACAMEPGELVGDDHGPAGLGHAAHFPQRRLVITVVVEAPD